MGTKDTGGNAVILPSPGSGRPLGQEMHLARTPGSLLCMSYKQGWLRARPPPCQPSLGAREVGQIRTLEVFRRGARINSCPGMTIYTKAVGRGTSIPLR